MHDYAGIQLELVTTRGDIVQSYSPDTMPAHHAHDRLAPLSDAAAEALARSWDAGELHGHAERVLAFVERHREEIRRLAGDSPAEHALLEAARRLISHAGTVHAASEMQDQMRAIRDEIWIRGERGDYDRENIASDWASQHAANWRQWRVREYLYVVDRCAADIVWCLNARQ